MAENKQSADVVPKKRGRKPGDGNMNLKGGSRKGVPNKATKEIKDMIRGALDKVGGQAYLERQAEENPTAFMTLIGKVIPKDVNANITLVNPAEELEALRQARKKARGES